MPVELQKKHEGIPVSEMKDGQIGEIVKWSIARAYEGRIVQKSGSDLISIGMVGGCSWHPMPKSKDCRVRLLEPGETIVITEN